MAHCKSAIIQQSLKTIGGGLKLDRSVFGAFDLLPARILSVRNNRAELTAI
jgi:hypothetical protein